MILTEFPLDGRQHVDAHLDHRIAFYIEEADELGVRRSWWRCNTCGATTDLEGGGLI